MNLLIFDLDGTLIDSKLDLVHAVNATRANMGLTELPQAVVFSYVGNGAPTLIRRSLGQEASEAQVQQGLDFFLAYYRDHMLDHTTLYPGVTETLDTLLENGKRMAVLTNKPVRISKAILSGLGLEKHFFQVYGGNSFEQKKPHPIGIQTLLSEAGMVADNAMMIGDSAVDIQTARNAGIKACGVTYGFQPESLAADPPDFLIDRFADLSAIAG
ncbi:MAG: HAD-IA family hydrolase [Bryobacteraceae bacterium]